MESFKLEKTFKIVESNHKPDIINLLLGLQGSELVQASLENRTKISITGESYI